MASSLKFICLVFFLLTLFSAQIDGRESQFFSKVSPSPTTTTTLDNNNAKNTPKEEDQQPSFVRETQSYGLYGQESSELPTTKLANARYTTSSYVPNYKPETYGQNQETYSNYPNSNNNYYSNNRYYNNNNNNDAYKEQQENLGETSLQETGYSTKSNQNNYHYNGANGYSNNGKQGMSDTRFLENGKYFYDIKNEKNYYQNYQDPEGYYKTNGNPYQYNGNRGRYQNQNYFQESQDEHYVP